MQGIKNENADVISCNDFDALIGATSEALAREAFAQMDVHLNIQRVLGPLLDLKFEEYGKQFSNVLSKVQAQMEPVTVDKETWTKDNRYMCYEDRIVLPRVRAPA